VTLLKVKTISPLKTNKFTPDSRRSPSSLPLLIIGIKTSSWITLSKLRSANENRRSGKEPHPSRVLFIGRNKRLKDYYALGPKTKKRQSKGRRVQRSPSHRPVRLQLVLDRNSTMVPRAPPAVVPPPVLRPDWEAIA
jgi:hypothetical protein